MADPFFTTSVAAVNVNSTIRESFPRYLAESTPRNSQAEREVLTWWKERSSHSIPGSAMFA